ncbi:hypothetical protein CsatB_012276 [Cannabis sativa]
MTNYGTIPTSSSPSANLEYISRAKDRIKAGLSTRRPWKMLYNFRSFGLPASFKDAIGRVRTNAAYFRMNYAIVILVILFLSLLWHPISLIVYIVMAVVWLFFYFLRDEPLVILGHTIDDRIVLVVLAVLTIGSLLFTNATTNILVSVLVGAAVVVVHAAFRKTDDLFLDEENTGLMTTTGVGAGSSSS